MNTYDFQGRIAVTPEVADAKQSAQQNPEFLKEIVSKIPRVRMFEPGETVSIICFWACKENPFTIGAVFDLSSDGETY